MPMIPPTLSVTDSAFLSPSSTLGINTEPGSEQAIVFGVLGTIIGVGSLVFAGLTLRLAYKSRRRADGTAIRYVTVAVPPY
jgi:hypothetical protein